MAYPCLWSLVCMVTGSNIIWMTFVRRKSVSTCIECMNIFILVFSKWLFLYLMLMTAGHIWNICCASVNIITFWLQLNNMNPSSHCRTGIFENFKKGRCPYSYCHKKHHFDIFGILSGTVYMEVYLNTWNRDTFRTLFACMHCESIGSFKDESWTIGYIPELNWNWRAHNRASFFNGFELFVKLKLSEVVISAPKVGSVNLHA